MKCCIITLMGPFLYITVDDFLRQNALFLEMLHDFFSSNSLLDSGCCCDYVKRYFQCLNSKFFSSQEEEIHSVFF